MSVAEENLLNLAMVGPDGAERKPCIPWCPGGRSRPDIDRGWAWPVLFASWFSQVIAGGAASSIGTFHLFLVAAFPDNEAHTAVMGSLFSGLTGCLGPIASLVADATSVRVCILIGGILTTVGMIASSQATNSLVIFITYGIVSGIGLGLSFTPAVVIPGYYFVEKRSMACGIGVTGYSFGIIVIPVILRALEAEYGWRGAFLVTAGITLNMCVCGMIMRPSVIERRRGVPAVAVNVDKLESGTNTITSTPKGCSSCRSSYDFIASLRFWSLWCVFLLSNVSMNIVFLYLPAFSYSLGATSSEMSLLYVLIGFFNMASRVLIGLATNDTGNGTALDKVSVLFGSLGVQSIAMLFFPWYASSAAGRLAFAAICGFYYGVQPSVTTPLTIDCVGLEKVSPAVGMIMFGKGLGMIVGPPMATALYNSTKVYTSVFIFGGFVNLAAALFCILMALCSGKVKDAVTYTLTSTQGETETRLGPSYGSGELKAL